MKQPLIAFIVVLKKSVGPKRDIALRESDLNQRGWNIKYLSEFSD